MSRICTHVCIFCLALEYPNLISLKLIVPFNTATSPSPKAITALFWLQMPLIKQTDPPLCICHTWFDDMSSVVVIIGFSQFVSRDVGTP